MADRGTITSIISPADDSQIATYTTAPKLVTGSSPTFDYSKVVEAISSIDVQGTKPNSALHPVDMNKTSGATLTQSVTNYGLVAGTGLAGVGSSGSGNAVKQVWH